MSRVRHDMDARDGVDDDADEEDGIHRRDLSRGILYECQPLAVRTAQDRRARDSARARDDGNDDDGGDDAPPEEDEGRSSSSSSSVVTGLYIRHDVPPPPPLPQGIFS